MDDKPINIKNAENDANYIGNELELFSHAKNWKSYWASKVRPLLEEPILEVGAGIGSNLKLLRDDKQDWFALEPDTDQALAIRKNYADDDNLKIICGFMKDIDLALTFQTILYVDVLEHIELDAEEVKRAAERLRPGGKLIIISPAHNSLFSPFDQAVGHFRRYNKKMLRDITPEKLQVNELYYLDSVGCAASLANAKLLKSSMPTIGQILLWDRVMVPISKLVDKLIFHTVGKTIVVVWEAN